MRRKIELTNSSKKQYPAVMNLVHKGSVKYVSCKEQ